MTHGVEQCALHRTFYIFYHSIRFYSSIRSFHLVCICIHLFYSLSHSVSFGFFSGRLHARLCYSSACVFPVPMAVPTSDGSNGWKGCARVRQNVWHSALWRTEAHFDALCQFCQFCQLCQAGASLSKQLQSYAHRAQIAQAAPAAPAAILNYPNWSELLETYCRAYLHMS